jgi:hypothetical protein
VFIRLTLVHHDSVQASTHHHHFPKIQLITTFSGFNSSSGPQAPTHHHPRLQLIIISPPTFSQHFRTQPPRPSQVPPRQFQMNLRSTIQASSLFISHQSPSNFLAESRQFRPRIPVRLQQRREGCTPATSRRIATSVRLLGINIRPNNF